VQFPQKSLGLVLHLLGDLAVLCISIKIETLQVEIIGRFGSWGL